MGTGLHPHPNLPPLRGKGGERGAVFVGGGVVEEDEGMGLRIREDTGCRAARDGSVPSRGHGMGGGIG